MQPRVLRLFVLLSLSMVLGVGACGGGSQNDSSLWVGHTYLLDIPSTNWSEPRGIGGDVGGFVPQFLFSVQRGTGQDLTITVGTATGGVQDPCNQTVQVTTSGASYPTSKIVVPSFPLHIIDKNQMPTVVVDATVHDFSFNTILPDAAATKSGDIAATIDAAEVYPLFRLVPNPSKESVCMALASANAPCSSCAHNGQPYCLTIKAVQLGGTQTTAAVKTIAPGDIPSSCAKP